MSQPIYAIGEKKPEKKFRASTGFEPVTSANTGAMMVYQLSYKTTHWEPGHFCGFIFFLTDMFSVENSTYAVEGRQETLHRLAYRIRGLQFFIKKKNAPANSADKDESKESSISFLFALPYPNNLPSSGNTNNSLCKLNTKEVLNLGVLQKMKRN